MIDLPTDDNATELDRLRFALQSAQIGTWTLDIYHQQVWWDARCRELYGFGQDDIVPYDQVLSYMHEEDRQRVNQAVQWALDPQSGGHYEVQFRTVGADDGQIRWLLCRGRADFDAHGEALRFAGTAQDITPQVVAQQTVLASETRFQNLVRDANVGMNVLLGQELRVTVVNEAYGRIIGHRLEEMQNRPLFELIPDAESYFRPLLERVMATGEPLAQQEVPYNLRSASGQLIEGFIDFLYQPYREADGRITGVMTVVNDVTQLVNSRQTIAQSEAKLRALIQEAPVATCLFVGRELRIELANPMMLNVWGKDQSVLGRPLVEAVPELKGQPFLAILDEVFTSGQAYRSRDARAELAVDGVLGTYYFDFTYKPLFNEAGEVYAIMDMAVDVTQPVINCQRLEQTHAQLTQTLAHLSHREAHLQLLSNTVPAMIFYLDLEQRYQSYNVTFMRWFGVDETQLRGKTVREFIGETAYQAIQPHLTIAYAGQQEQYELAAPAAMGGERWLNITYTPHKCPSGQVIGLIVHAADITRNKQTEAVLREREVELRNAIELAELGTWKMNVATGAMTYSQRLQTWLGVTDAVLGRAASSQIHPRDRQRVSEAIEQALAKGGPGRYDQTYTITHALTGQERIIHANGQTVFDSAGTPLLLTGTAQDVTLQLELQLALEQQVQQRTQELATTNEALVRTNESFVAANQALERANSDLIRSNQNLEQFAYIASHDLQEPLRKIQQFGDLLQGQYSEVLGEGVTFLKRMQLAASRMSVLIKDLLAFSRIATTQAVAQPVRLNEVVNQVLESLSVAIEESGAQIEVDELPTVQGDRLQLGQLFQNLLANALKFRRTGLEGQLLTPQIVVRAGVVARGDLLTSAQPARDADQYHLIEVIDNGIGFEEKYLDRIFQVFQRLHGKNEFAGTGVGLAIVQKVVTNHGGAITASGKLGEGATFCVYIPT